MRSSALLCASLLSACLVAGCSKPDSAATPQGDATSTPMAATAPAAVTELKSDDLTPGSGDAIGDGDVAIVHYTGWLYDPAAPDQKGAKFDSSRDRGEPFRFTVGGSQVIQGWDKGVLGMQVGGQRRLTIPPDLGYGAAGAGGVIPPNAALLFDVELLGIEPTSAPPQ